jgi:glycerol-3-phosphate dehydrogenase
VIGRADALSALSAERFDVVVVGGGITGAGVALDAASRGFSVALLERADFASGTSSRSSKLVHGGLRYLRSLDLGLVREALLERSLMVRLAPHLVRPLPLLVPSFDQRRRGIGMSAGLNLYDVMAAERPRRRGRGWRDEREAGPPTLDPRAEELWSPDRHRMVDAEEALELIPALRGRPPTSAYLFFDCQCDDVRLVLSVLGEAERFGAVCANRCEVLGLLEESGRATGVRALDRASGAELEVRADHVVNATGVWADRLLVEDAADGAEAPHIRPSRGTHLTISSELLPMSAGAIAPTTEGRTIFLLPWLGRTLIGTTDRDYDGPLEHVPPAEEDVDHLLETTSRFFDMPVGRDQVTGAYAGVRPLISSPDSRKSADISRRAELFESPSGLITITGGKLTTWRRMAKLAVDRVVERDRREAACRTHEIPIGEPIEPSALPEVPGVAADARPALAARYGHAAEEVLAIAASSPSLARPILPGLPDLLAEAVFAVRREQAQHVGDVLLRRTRLGLLDARALCVAGAEAPHAVAQAMGAELGWDSARIGGEVEAWSAEARAEGIVPVAGAPSEPLAVAG